MSQEILDNTRDPGRMIQELHCWVATYKDGSEGIMAGGFAASGMLPLMSSRRQTAQAMEPIARRAQQMANREGRGVVAVRLVSFVTTERPRVL